MLTAAKLGLAVFFLSVSAGESYEQWLRRGRELLAEKRWEEAERALREAVEANPRAFEPHVELGRLHLEQKQARAALQELDRALELARGEFAALFLRGMALIQLQKFEEAALELETALDKRPQDVDCRQALGLASFRARHFSRALEVLKPLVEAGTAGRAVQALYGGALLRMGRSEESLAALEKALLLQSDQGQGGEALLYLGLAQLSLGRFEEAASAFSRGLASSSLEEREESELVLGLAEAELKLGQKAAARSRLESFLTHSPEHGRAWFIQGLIEEEEKNYTAAAANYQKGIERGYDEAEAHLRRGVSLAHAGDPEAAGQALDRALEKNPQLSAAHYYKGMLLSQRGKPVEAAALLEQAARLDPEDSRGAIALADVYLVLRQYERAIEAAERAARSPALAGRAFYLQAIAHHQARELSEAKACYEKAIAQGLDSAEVYLNLGKLLITLSQFREARQMLDQALRRDGNQADAHFQLGIAATQLRQYDAALDHLDRSLELAPGSAETWYRKGVVESRQGRRPAAVSSWKKALALQPDSTEVYYRLGSELVKLGQVEEGEKLLREFRDRSSRASLDSQRSTRLENVLLQALLLAKERRDDGALRFFQQALEIDPQSPLTYPALGEFHLVRGRTAEAEAVLLQGLAHHPQSVPMRELLLSVYQATGDRERAEQERKRLEELKSKK